jgi:eukaryotic-like serine/threonine-protein kinase
LRGTPVLHNGVVYIGCYDNNLYALNALHLANFSGNMLPMGVLSAARQCFEDAIYFGSEDHRLHAVSIRTGKLTLVLLY